MMDKKKSNRVKEFFVNYKELIITLILTLVFSTVAFFLIYIPLNSEWVGNISGVLQIATTVFAFIAWNNTRKLIEKRKKARVEIGSEDLILTISLAADIKKQVNEYIAKKGLQLKEIEVLESDNNVLFDSNNKYMLLEKSDSLPRALCISKKNDMPKDELSCEEYIHEFRECIKKFNKIVIDNPVRKIHVFMSTPIEIPAFMMPYFVNKKDVIMYRYVKEENTYVSLGPVEER